MCARGGCDWVITHKEQQRYNATRSLFAFYLAKPPRVRENGHTPITMRKALLLALLSTVAALRVGTSGLSRRAAIAGGAAVTLLPPPGFASSGSMAGKTVLIVRWPQVEPPSLHATSD